MALVRRGGCTFFIRSVRRNGRVTSEYVGSGSVAVLAAQRSATEQSRREDVTVRWQAEKRRLVEVDEAVSDVCRGVESIARTLLLAWGFHQHKGQWRKRRGMKNPLNSSVQVTSSSTADLLRRAHAGDASTLPELRKYLEDRPDAFDEIGDVASYAERHVIEAFAGMNLLCREAMARKMARLTEELAGSDPSPIERLLARRAALCWLTVNAYETTYARQATELTLAQADFHQKRIDRAHKRLLSALRSLALIRRMPIAAVQVNIDRIEVESAAEPSETLAQEPGRLLDGRSLDFLN